MKQNERFFSKFITASAVLGSLLFVCDFADAATRASTRALPASRKTVTATTQTNKTETTEQQDVSTDIVDSDVVYEPTVEQPVITEQIIENKTNRFEIALDEVMESATEDNTFAEQIRRQRAALAASESTFTAKSTQNKALTSNSSSCDVALRKCMMKTCGNDFTKCATDGDTVFGDKLNKCRRDTTCNGKEFSSFGAEIKADRDMNIRLSSYNSVLDCGNSYNACIVNECGTTYSKCLGKKNADAAIQKCSTIATECRESDSGLASRFGTAIGKLRENAEKDIKKDENRLYELRDLMANSCKSLGAAFDERSFDCVYTVNFFAGENQSTPIASRKAYAGDSFVCMPEWFGTDVTTYRENAYRETRAQTAASSAMLGSGLGTAAGAISSGAIDRAKDTTKAKNALKNAENAEDKAEKKETTEQKSNETSNKTDPQTEQLRAGMSAAVSGRDVYKAMQQKQQEQQDKIKNATNNATQVSPGIRNALKQ